MVVVYRNLVLDFNSIRSTKSMPICWILDIWVKLLLVVCTVCRQRAEEEGKSDTDEDEDEDEDNDLESLGDSENDEDGKKRIV